MSSAPTPRTTRSRPKYYDLNLAHLPPPGLVSIFHRISGALLFFPILPLALYLLQSSLASEQSHGQWREFFDRPLVKLALLVFVWAYMHHFFAGIRYLLLDLHIGIQLPRARSSAVAVLVLGVLATVLIGWRLW
jgi:succinate dehydrogenase / fumarate reductase cytochrome b subunit